MVELSKSPKARVIFPKGGQQSFLNEAVAAYGGNYQALATSLGINQRTFRNWRSEDYSISYSAVNQLCNILNISIPADVEIKDQYWYTRKSPQAGWLAVKKKYGKFPVDENYRKMKWREWWDREGRAKGHSVVGVRKLIKHPRLTSRLGEFVGIVMGDGGISDYQIKVSMSSVVDREYSQFVKNLIEDLFDVSVTILEYPNRGNILDLVVSRIALVDFCRSIGLKKGNKLKQGLDIPNWIYKKPTFQKSCLRGLMDTDGGIFFERHKIGGKVYSYPRLSFVSYSPLLTKSVFDLMKEMGFSPRMRRANRAVQLENTHEIRQYFRTVGSHNPKHYKRLLAG